MKIACASNIHCPSKRTIRKEMLSTGYESYHKTLVFSDNRMPLCWVGRGDDCEFALE